MVSRFLWQFLSWATPQERMLISAGEKSGTLPQSLFSLIEIMDAGKVSGLRSCLGLRISIFGGYLLVFFVHFGVQVVPTMTDVVKGKAATWHGAAAGLVAYSWFVQKFMWWVVGILPVIVFCFFIRCQGGLVAFG